MHATESLAFATLLPCAFRAAFEAEMGYRSLPTAERLRVVEQVVHEVATEVIVERVAPSLAIWADESDSDFQAFESTLRHLRATDTWRVGDGQDPA